MFYDEETQKRYWRNVLITIGSVFLLIVFSCILINSGNKPGTVSASGDQNPTEENSTYNNNDDKKEDAGNNKTPETNVELFTVLSVTDGDTIRIDYHGVSTSVRLIGVDTPETVDERTVVQCFGKGSSEYLKNLLSGKKVSIEADPTQSDRDKYDRLLRYVYLDGEDVSLSIIKNGYGHEYTYNIPYQKQSEYKNAEKTASENNLGLWSPSTCNGDTTKADTSTKKEPTTNNDSATTQQTTKSCLIKGNINNKGEKIYHIPGQQYYNDTVITPSKGERYFCTEEEAKAAGWRKAKV